MTDDFIQYVQEGAVVTLIMNRPATLNALTGDAETRPSPRALSNLAWSPATVAPGCCRVRSACHAPRR